MLSDNMVRSAGVEEKSGAKACGDDPPKVHDYVNGLSITPKGAFCVFKLWLGETAPKEPGRYVIPPFQGQALYKSHAACMVEASNKAIKPPSARR
jgi:hypothetical protein